MLTPRPGLSLNALSQGCSHLTLGTKSKSPLPKKPVSYLDVEEQPYCKEGGWTWLTPPLCDRSCGSMCVGGDVKFYGTLTAPDANVFPGIMLLLNRLGEEL